MLQTKVEADDVQHVEVLAFVFVDALDLNVEKRVGVQADAAAEKEMICEVFLSHVLDSAPAVLEGAVSGIGLQSAELVQIARQSPSMISSSRAASGGLARAMKRRGVTPLVLFWNFSGHRS